jgi:transcription termination/antitermination protein NusG
MSEFEPGNHGAEKRGSVSAAKWPLGNAGELAAGDRWFAVRTKSRQEKTAASALESLGVTSFLPLKSEIHRWSDRNREVRLPLFSGYVFVRMNPARDRSLPVFMVPGIAGFVGNANGPLPIPDEQIEAVRTVLSRGVKYALFPFLEEGDRVRIVRGALAGVEGILDRIRGVSRLVISIDMIHQSIVVTVSREDVEPVDRCAPWPTSTMRPHHSVGNGNGAGHTQGALLI